MAGSRIPFAGHMDYINTPSDDDLHGIAHAAASCSRMPLGMDDSQELQQNRIDMEISRLSAELTKALNEILARVRADAQLKDNLLDEYSIFGQSMIYLGAAMDGAWESIEGYGEVLFDTALFIGRRIHPFSRHETLREDMKNMESFVRMSRDKIAGLDITDEDLILYYQLVRDGQVFDKLLDFSKAYVKSLSSVDQVRMATSLLPDLLLVLVTGGIGLTVSGASKALHLQKIQPILRKLGSALRNALHRRKTQRKNFGGGPGEGSGGNSLSSSTSSTTENKLPPPSRRRRAKPDNTQDTVDKIEDRTKSTKPDEAFHYTEAKWKESINKNGLRPGSYATPAGDLSPTQAAIELALPPNRNLPDAKLRIDLEAMKNDGYKIPKPTRVSNVVTAGDGRVYTQPGGGYEMKFDGKIPPKYISIVE